MFDPYHKWLGIVTKEQPPNHYRLLHLELYEGDLDVIEGAADRAMGFVRQYQSGERAMLAAKLLNEIASARLCLLKPESKADYDTKLRKKLAIQEKPKLDDAPDEFDAKLSDLMAVPMPLVRSRRKKTRQLPGLWIAVGAGAVVCLVVVGLAMNSGGKPRDRTEPIEKLAADSPSTSLPSKISAPSPAVTSARAVTPGPAATLGAMAINSSPKIALLESKRISDPTGPPVDLLRAVELPRDALSGEWKFTGTTLYGGPDGTVYLPVKAPPDYQLNLKVKRVTGNDTLLIGFPMDGRIGAVEFDGFNSKYSGLYVDGHPPNSNCTTHQGPMFRNGEVASIAITVHPEHFHAAVNGTTIVDWHGDAGRLISFSDRGQVNREQPFLTVVSSPFQIESAVMVSIKTDETSGDTQLKSSIDLIPLIELSRDAPTGGWALGKNALTSPEGWNQVRIPVKVPDEYTLLARIERPADSGVDSTLIVGLVAGASACQVVVFNTGGLGLEMIDGQRWNSNETHGTGHQLKPGESANVALTVTKRGIRYDFEGRTLIDWRGDFRRLSRPHDNYLADARALFLGSCAKYIFHDLKIGPPVDPLRFPTHDPPALGTPLDLSSLVDPKRDALAGTWTKDSKSLRVLGDTTHCKLVVPCEVPTEYKLMLRVAREENGNAPKDALLLCLPFESSNAELVFDSGSTTTGLYVDRLQLSEPRNMTARRTPTIPPGPPREFEIFVRKTGIKVLSGETTIIEWNGNPNRLSLQPEWGVPNSTIGICCWNSRFRIEKLEMEPLEPSPFAAVAKLGEDGNVLSIMDPVRDSRAGQWTLDSKGLLSPKLAGARIRIPVPVPKQYVLTAKVERQKGDGDLLLGLVVDGHPCNAAIDGVNSTTAGLTLLDGKVFYAFANPTRHAYATPIFPIGESVTVRCSVLSDTVIINCGNRDVIRWHGDARRLSECIEYRPPNMSGEDLDHLWLGAWESQLAIRDLQLKPLDNEEAAQIRGGFTGVFPTAIKLDIEPEGGLPFDQIVSEQPVGGDVFLVVNTSSARCLSVKDGAIVQGPYASKAGPRERWRFASAGEEFKLFNEQSGKVLAIPGGSKEKGTQLIEYQNSNVPDQRWELIKKGNHYVIRSRVSGLVLAVPASNKNENINVIQWPHEEYISDQVWRLQKTARGGKK